MICRFASIDLASASVTPRFALRPFRRAAAEELFEARNASRNIKWFGNFMHREEIIR